MIDTVLITLNRRKNIKPVAVGEHFESLSEEEKSTWLDFAPSFFYEHERLLDKKNFPCKQIINSMIISIREDFLTSQQQTQISAWKQKINKTNDGIDEIFEETDPCVISGVMWTWLRLLKVMKNIVSFFLFICLF